MYDPTEGRWLSDDPEGFDGGDTNLYRYVGNSPTNFTDPTGLDKVSDQELADAPLLASNNYGKFYVVNRESSYTNRGVKQHGSLFGLKFVPTDKVTADSIGFVQSVRILEDDRWPATAPYDEWSARRTMGGGYWIDRAPGFAQGWYGVADDGKPLPSISAGDFKNTPLADRQATMRDAADLPASKVNYRMEFEVAIIGRGGNQNNKIYGVIDWGYYINAQGKWFAYGATYRKIPNMWWVKAVKAWNQQADNNGYIYDGPVSTGIRKKNAPEQQRLPALTPIDDY